jgi:hypothetical protein
MAVLISLPGKVPLLLPTISYSVAVSLVLQVHINTEKKLEISYLLVNSLRICGLTVRLHHPHPVTKVLLCFVEAVLITHAAGPAYLREGFRINFLNVEYEESYSFLP